MNDATQLFNLQCQYVNFVPLPKSGQRKKSINAGLNVNACICPLHATLQINEYDFFAILDLYESASVEFLGGAAQWHSS